MAETAAALPRSEVVFIAYDPTGGNAVQTLVESAAGMIRADDEFWTVPSKLCEVLTELQNAVAILEKRCDLICERELAF